MFYIHVSADASYTRLRTGQLHNLALSISFEFYTSTFFFSPEKKFKDHIHEDQLDGPARRILKRDTASYDDKYDYVSLC